MKKILYILILFPFYSCAQIITTYVGNGISGGGGDGGPATNAQLNNPAGLNFDNNGNLLVCQRGKIRKVNTSTEIIYTIAGNYPPSMGVGDGRPADSALMDNPYAICADAAGNFFIGDYWTTTVRKVDELTNIINAFTGTTFMPGSTGDGGPATAAKIGGVWVCIDTLRNYLYISDTYGHKIRRVDIMTGIITTFAGTGVNGYSGDGGLASSAKLSRTAGICLDHLGNLYFSDWDNARIRKVDVGTETITTVAGIGTTGYSGDAGLATSAMITRATGLCFDNCGNLFFADEVNQRVRKIDAITGIITTVAGNGTAGFSGDGFAAATAQFNYPGSIAIDDAGNLYVSDYYNNRVRKIIFNPGITPTITINATDTVCSSTSVTFTATASIGGPSYTYQWLVNGIPVSNDSSYTYIPLNGDSIRCVLSAVTFCNNSTSNTITMSVIPITTPTITVTAPAAASVGSTVTVNATVSGAGTGYMLHWYNNAVLFSTTAVPTTTYTKPPGTDHITATVLPGEGCYDSTTSAEWLVTASTTSVGNTSSPGVTVSGAELRGEAIYPNPVHDVLHINTNDGKAYSIQNMVGQVLQHGILKQGDNTINVKELPTGVYMLETVDPSGSRTITKILKQP